MKMVCKKAEMEQRNSFLLGFLSFSWVAESTACLCFVPKFGAAVLEVGAISIHISYRMALLLVISILYCLSRISTTLADPC